MHSNEHRCSNCKHVVVYDYFKWNHLGRVPFTYYICNRKQKFDKFKENSLLVRTTAVEQLIKEEELTCTHFEEAINSS